MRYVVSLLSIVITFAIAPIGLAQNSQDPARASSNPKTPAARIFESHQDTTKKAPAKTPRNAGIIDSQTKDQDHTVTLEEHKTIPYRPCIDARGWKNGRLVCADEAEKTQLQNGHEVEGPYSPQ
jgi:hypothetical protein